MHLCNTARALHRSDLTNQTTREILQIPVADKLVAMGAFCLMPNHFHFLLSPIKENGISRFMQKLGTAYSMYFNIKYERVGGLFISPFRSKHLRDDEYFQYAIQYVHCNPAELYEQKWKEGNARDIGELEKKLLDYPYSSFGAFNGTDHIFRTLLNSSVFTIETQVSPKQMLEDAREYYESMSR